jgi:hypothetical protein
MCNVQPYACLYLGNAFRILQSTACVNNKDGKTVANLSVNLFAGILTRPAWRRKVLRGQANSH